ncbi:MAG: hypothetical protein EOO02_09315 [Chitinophagaceae bacterium]|nr:MAG: hypothetical protein EOO02_09315 [Chitinophagaceae bacterium]
MLTLSSTIAFSQADQLNSEPGSQTFANVYSYNNEHPEYKGTVSVKREFVRTKGLQKRTIAIAAFKSSGHRSVKAGTIVGLSAVGDTQFVAHYKRNKLKGNWVSKFDDDQLCDSGALKNNVPDGLWKSWYGNGQLRFIRSYDAFKLEKAKRDIGLRDSRAVSNPLATIAKKNLQAAYSYLHPDYSFHTLASQPKNFSTHDAWDNLNDMVSQNIAVSSAGYIPPFSECLHHGLYMNFYANGNVKDSGYYQNGLREGIWEEWVEDGNIKSQGFYSQGKKTNTWKFYSKDGKLKYMKAYNKNGKEIFRKRYL